MSNGLNFEIRYMKFHEKLLKIVCPTVFDVGPALVGHRVDVSCLLGDLFKSPGTLGCSLCFGSVLAVYDTWVGAGSVLVHGLQHWPSIGRVLV